MITYSISFSLSDMFPKASYPPGPSTLLQMAKFLFLSMGE